MRKEMPGRSRSTAWARRLASTVLTVGITPRTTWPDGAPDGRNVLDVHMAKLRRLLAGTGVDIRTVHRRGYLMHLVTADEAAVTAVP